MRRAVEVRRSDDDPVIAGIRRAGCHVTKSLFPSLVTPVHTYQMTETSTLQSQLALWHAQQAQRTELNDDLATPRPVEHFAVFRRRAFANVAGAQLQAQGFRVEIGRRGVQTILQATRNEPLDHASVERFLGEVIAVVEGSRGAYDGWGATVEVPA